MPDQSSESSAPPEPEHYTPSTEIAHKLSKNRTGHITRGQRVPIIIAGFLAAVAFICPATMIFSVLYGFVAGISVSVFGWVLTVATLLSFGFLAAVLWVNARMFLPEALMRKPVVWEQDVLEIKLAERNRPEMPFSYIIGDYSFAPFIAPDEVPLQRGREYIVYYTPRSRLLLSIAPTDQPESENWLPESDETAG